MTWTALVGPTLIAAVVAGLVSILVATINSSVLLRSQKEKLNADRDKAMSDKAWADYELRRDAYIEIARQIDSLFEGGDPARRPELHRTIRRVRLVGSDQVVRAANDLTAAIREGRSDVLEQKYRALFNAMRRDIRQLHTRPPEGTDLGEEAFPIEG